MTSLNIGLLWHAAAAGNLGVGALTIGNLALARQAATRAGITPHFTLFGGRESGPAYVSGPDISHRTIDGRYMVNPGGYLVDARRQHIMLDIGGGDSFADIYTDKRFAYIIATKAIALALGKPLILSPQTIGPFTRQPHTAIAAAICRRSSHVFARDPLSMQALDKLAPGAYASQAIDVAFALPFTRPERTADAPLHIGLNVSGLLMNGGYGGQNQYGLTIDYPALTTQLITALLGRPNTRVSLVPHVLAPNMPVDDDRAAAESLVARFPALGLHVPTSPQDAKSFISGLDFMIGARMHATIAAYSAGVPVVPISYSRKFEGLYGGLDYPWLVPAKGMTTEAALAYILDALDRRQQLAADIQRGSAIVKAGLETYVSGLTTAFRSAL